MKIPGDHYRSLNIIGFFLPFGLRAIWEQMAVEVASRGVRTTTMIKQNEMKTQHAKHDTASRNLECHRDFFLKTAQKKSSDHPLKRVHRNQVG